MQPDGPILLLSSIGEVFEGTCVNGLVLLAKISGNSPNWNYNSPLWTSSNASLNPTSLAFDLNEAKLKAYSQLPIQGLRVGMSNLDGSSLTWIDVPLGESYASLQSAMSEGSLSTHAGRSAWTSLVPDDHSFSWEPYCNLEGLNVACSYGPTLRLGLLMNDGTSCDSCDDAVGFGLNIWGNYESAGAIGGGNYNKFGYILGFPGKVF